MLVESRVYTELMTDVETEIIYLFRAQGEQVISWLSLCPIQECNLLNLFPRQLSGTAENITWYRLQNMGICTSCANIVNPHKCLRN